MLCGGTTLEGNTMRERRSSRDACLTGSPEVNHHPQPRKYAKGGSESPKEKKEKPNTKGLVLVLRKKEKPDRNAREFRPEVCGSGNATGAPSSSPE